MIMNEVGGVRYMTTLDIARLDELEKWFRFEYPKRKLDIDRDVYLGLTPRESRYELEKEAYDKENEIRFIKGLEPLEKIKINKII